MSTERHPIRRFGVALAPMLLVMALTACGEDEPLPEIAPGTSEPTSPATDESDGAATGSGSGSAARAGVPDVRPAPEQGDKVEDEYGVWAVQLPENGAKRMAAQAFADYLDARMRSYHTGEASLGELAKVAVGDPLTEVQGYVLDLRERGLHTVGDLWIEVEAGDVTAKGPNATLSGVCLHNATVDVNEAGVAQESPPDSYLAEATAYRAGPDTWLIRSVTLEEARC